jgi:hypothetical protein
VFDATPRPLYPREKDPQPIVQEGGRAQKTSHSPAFVHRIFQQVACRYRLIHTCHAAPIPYPCRSPATPCRVNSHMPCCPHAVPLPFRAALIHTCHATPMPFRVALIHTCHATPMPFPCHAVPRYFTHVMPRPCHSPTVPCPS